MEPTRRTQRAPGTETGNTSMCVHIYENMCVYIYLYRAHPPRAARAWKQNKKYVKGALCA